jgi:hypothetical protein
MHTPQAGIFSLGTSSHAYLEFDLLDAKKCKEFAAAISAIREPRTTTGGVNFVIGFRPELWRDVVPDEAPPGLPQDCPDASINTKVSAIPLVNTLATTSMVRSIREAVVRGALR